LRAGIHGHVAQSVVLTGWVARRRDHGGVAFLDLRDASGVAQVVVRDEVLAQGGAHDLRNEYCVKVTGQVRLRPEGNANAGLPTGEIEVVATELEVLRLCRSRSTSASLSARRRGSSTDTLTFAAPAPLRQFACAAR